MMACLLYSITSLVMSLPISFVIHCNVLNQGSSMKTKMFWTLVLWSAQVKERNGSKTLTTFVAMWAYKISNSKSKSPHYRASWVIDLQLNSTHNVMVMLMATCNASNMRANAFYFGSKHIISPPLLESPWQHKQLSMSS
jgi:hypothetical protein